MIATLEGKGISKSQCPSCKVPAWKKDLKKNCTYETAIDMMMKAKEVSQKTTTSSRVQQSSQASPSRPHLEPEQQAPPAAPPAGPSHTSCSLSHLMLPHTSCSLSYATFHELLSQLLTSEFHPDKILPLHDGSQSPLLAKLEKMVIDNPPILSRTEESRMRAELSILDGWLEEADALIEMKENQLKADVEKNQSREAEMLQLLGGNSNSGNVPDPPPALTGALKRHRPSASTSVTGVTITCADSHDFKPKLDQFAKLLSSSDGVAHVKISKDVSERTSHVIVGGLDENGLARYRSRNFLLGILRGCWMLSTEWVDACVECGYLVDETEYEVKGDIYARGGPEKGRKSSLSSYSHQDTTKQSLFGNLRVRIMRSTWPKDQMKNYEAVEKVLLIGGATLLKDDDRDALLSIVFATKGSRGGGSSSASVSAASAVFSSDDQMGVNTVNYRWVFDSISHFELLDFDQYT